MSKILPLIIVMAGMVGLSACSSDAKTIPCPVCYEDEWSREPFPGEAKQHIKPLTPDDIKANKGVTPMPLSPDAIDSAPAVDTPAGW